MKPSQHFSQQISFSKTNLSIRKTKVLWSYYSNTNYFESYSSKQKPSAWKNIVIILVKHSFNSKEEEDLLQKINHIISNPGSLIILVLIGNFNKFLPKRKYKTKTKFPGPISVFHHIHFVGVKQDLRYEKKNST